MQKFEKQRDYFRRLFKNGMLGHAYLFVGQNLAGKKECAEDVCEMLTGKRFENNPNIKLIYPDKEKNKIYIEGVRNLKSFMAFKPYSSEYKISVVADADTMTIEAANAMLKILEEPPKKSIIILISSKPRILPKTIISRCESVTFLPPAEVQTDEMIKAVAGLRKVKDQSMAERIKYAKNIYEKENYTELVNLWLRSLRLRLVDKPTTAPVLKNLLRLSYIVSQPQFNHKIALENFFIQL